MKTTTKKRKTKSSFKKTRFLNGNRFKTIVFETDRFKKQPFFKKLVVTLTIVNDEPSLTIVNYQEVLAPPQLFPVSKTTTLR